MKLKGLKGLTKVNGYYFYQRSVPKDIKDHPVFGGKKKYQKPLGAKIQTEEDIHNTWQEQHKAFESLILNLRKANLPLLNARKLREQATNLLKAHGFEVGQRSPSPYLTDDQNQMIETGTDMEVDHSSLLDAAKKFYWEKEHVTHEIEGTYDIPHHVQVAEESWILLNTPKDEIKKQHFLLSDCWNIYAEKKELDENDRSVKKTRSRWNQFVEFKGDCVLDSEQIHERLDSWVEHREQVRKDSMKSGNKATPSSSTIHKEIDMVCAIINLVVKLHRLNILIVKPPIQQTEPKIREVLSPPEVLEIISLAQDTSTSFYKPWKELTILLLAQTSCIASELIRMKKDSVILDQEVPVIKMEGDLKTKHRLRTIPLVYKVERIKELIEAEQSELILGEVAQTTESNLSKQLNQLVQQVNPEATSYSFRHTFKTNATLKDINPLHVAYLGGWSGSSLGLNEIMVNYGKAGMKTPEMLFKLQSVMKSINSHLLETEPTKNNVVELRA